MDSTGLNSKLEHDAKRDADHKHKWKLGDWSAVAGGKQRPWHLPQRPMPAYRTPQSLPKSSGDHYSATGSIVRKYPAVMLDNEVLSVSHDPSLAPYSSSNSSAGSVAHPSRAPEPDAGVAYSFDAQRGPTDGSDILGQAMSKAVLRFEDKKTTRLVKDEYDVVKGDEEDDIVGEMAEEDFELVGKFEM